MEKDVILWILGVAQVIVAAGVAWNWKSHNKHQENHTEVIVRLVKLEVLWSMMNKQAAEILHSPHTPELDLLLEKLVKTYNDRNYELTCKEWEQLQEMTQKLKEDENEPKGSRLLAAMVYAQCCHKLQLFLNI